MLGTLGLLSAIVGAIIAAISVLSNLVTITKDGGSALTVVKRALGMAERVNPSAVSTGTDGWSLAGKPSTPVLGNLATNAMLGGMSVALAGELLTHHGGQAHDLATATGELMNGADAALVGDLQGLADIPVEAATDLLGALGEFLRT